jgi:hypothetical protein
VKEASSELYRLVCALDVEWKARTSCIVPFTVRVALSPNAVRGVAGTVYSV